MNTIIELIKNRVSCPVLAAPAPSKGEIEEILACAMRAPDHARLRPWFYHVIQGEGLARLGDIFVQAIDGEGFAKDKIEKCRNMPLRAPLMIVAVCEPQENTKVSVMEQLLAVGASIQNMQVAISSLGYGSIWRTGDMAHYGKVKESFGLSEQGEVVGFLYVGTALKKPNKPSVDINDHVRYWE